MAQTIGARNSGGVVRRPHGLEQGITGEAAVSQTVVLEFLLRSFKCEMSF